MTRPIGQYQPASRSQVGAQAIDAAGDPHLAPGIHLRVLPSPELGLPVEPFRVFRVPFGRSPDVLGARQNIVWRRDRDRAFLIEPFEVTPDSPVTGYLPSAAQGACCWIAVLARPGGSRGIVDPPGGRVIAAHPFPGGAGAGPGAGGSPASRGPVPSLALPGVLARPASPVPGSLPGRTLPPVARPSLPFPPFVLPGLGLTVEALVLTESGPQVVASRSRVPFEMTATPIERIRLRGRGRVTGVRWLSVEDVLTRARDVDPIESGTTPAELWREMALPVGDGRNYAGAPPQPLEAANERAARTFPRRKGLQDHPDVPGPAGSPETTPLLEEARLEAVAEALRAGLTRLVDSTDPAAERDSAALDLAPDAGDLEGSIETDVLDSVLFSTLEPGVARWLGFGEVDESPPGDRPGDLVGYVIGGSWPGFDPIDGVPRPIHVATAACAVVGHPPDRPRRPGVSEIRSGDWLPVEPPPQARRRVEIALHGLVPGAGLALARHEGGTIVSLNRRVEAHEAELGRVHFPDEPAEMGPGETRVSDPGAPGEPVGYRLAQHDLFGRWSEWTEVAVEAAERPGPPRPVLFARYEAPEVPDPVPDGPLAGTIHVQAPVPAAAALAPGGRSLASLELSVDGTLHAVPVPDPPDPPRTLASRLTGPGLGRGGEREVTITGTWIDEDGRRSASSDPQALTLRDPRPAPPLELPSHLRFTARPDAMGRARFTLAWTAGPGQDSFRVFYGDEVRLRAGLEEIAAAGGPGAARAGAALQGIEAAAEIAERAGVFVEVSDLLDRRFFEQLTDAPLPASSGPELTFDHAVSGALRLLSFYRVVAISAAQVEAPFAGASLVPVAVPNADRPLRPALGIRPFFPEGSADPLIRAEITVPPGAVSAREFRLRRAIEGSAEAVGMPVVTTGFFEPGNGAAQSVQVLDTGTSEVAPDGVFRRWMRYVWVAEVRAAGPPGGGPPAEWSEPSPSAAYTFVSAAPPGPPTVAALERVGTAHTLRFAHPDPLTGGPPGGYVFDIYVQVPGDRARRLASIPAEAPAEAGGRDDADEFRFTDGVERPPGTAYRVVLRDPLGRASPGTDPVFVEAESDA